MIEINVRKKLSETFSVDVNVQFPALQITALSGASGAGKSTLLRMLAGLMKPDAGIISANGITWFDSSAKINLPPKDRAIGWVPQDAALFPHLNVKDNVTFGLAKGESHSFANELMERAGLSSLLKQMPSTLSGGQKQRTAIARALARKPSVLLLDEPFAALDEEARRELTGMLHAFHTQLQLTTVLVSHERISSADLVVAMENGRIIGREFPLTSAAPVRISPMGEIMEVKRVGDQCRIVIKVGFQQLEILRPASEEANFVVGKLVRLEGDLVNVTFRG
jgi:molybdate transport system ATP-binding protein